MSEMIRLFDGFPQIDYVKENDVIIQVWVDDRLVWENLDD